MAFTLNEIRIMGHIGQDAETKFTPSGVARTTFSVATTRSFKATPDAKEWTEATTWHRVIAWRVPERLLDYLKKGNFVFVKGRQENRSYEKDGDVRWVSEIVADQGGGEDQRSTVPAGRLPLVPVVTASRMTA
jgi:single-strand DNA-binding protein